MDLCIFTGKPDKNIEIFLLFWSVCGHTVGEKRERCHMCLLSACVGMIQGPCPIAEEQVKGRGCGEEQMLERINHEVMCFLLHSHTHTIFHIPHIRGV